MYRELYIYDSVPGNGFNKDGTESCDESAEEKVMMKITEFMQCQMKRESRWDFWRKAEWKLSDEDSDQGVSRADK